MRKNAATRLYVSAFFVVGILAGTPTPARAQFAMPTLNGPSVGSRYFIEASIATWSPGTEMAISSESLRIPGDVIDFKKDLGLKDQRFREVLLELRPAKRHKFRYQYIPIKYEQSATLTREVVFNGQRYTVGVPVNSGIDWRAHRFGYEYDFISLDRGFVGFVLDVKQTDVRAYLESFLVARENAHAAAPIPGIGGSFRVFVVPNLSITGTITGCCFGLIERLVDDATAHNLDLDFYGTFNITRNLGAKFGFRRLDLGYKVEEDFGDFELKGIYFGLVTRY